MRSSCGSGELRAMAILSRDWLAWSYGETVAGLHEPPMTPWPDAGFG